MENEFDFSGCGPLSAVVQRDSLSSTGSSVSASSTSNSTKTALNDCSVAWISYLNSLNNLCCAGSKLSSTLTVLEQCGLFGDKTTKSYAEKSFFHNHPSSYLTHYWNDLARSNTDPRSQTPSPNMGGAYKAETSRGNSITDQRPHSHGSLTSQQLDQPAHSMDQIRGTSPLQAIFENTKGPLPNPGHLLAMKSPFCRGVRSPLNIPLFPLNGQRRWSEAAAGEVIDDNTTDVENQMRRWSMPWEALKFDKNTVTWYQTRIMPINNINLLSHKKTCADRSISNTPELTWQSCAASHDGLTEAIQLLSCRPSKVQAPLSQGYTKQHGDTPNTD
ncbi:uncharacterized protein LOC128861190 isoform X3 [Anastrepha ludens]|uniref:uncharacterized protein LOC128861190 isoform X3 n=1 Tax=Anastrepha ludens TaxID=28586 RepID=UPI0023AEECF4|nr:uncharacterized protein LOC128861190 isoform X3 [Anastrepha ludens]